MTSELAAVSASRRRCSWYLAGPLAILVLILPMAYEIFVSNPGDGPLAVYERMSLASYGSDFVMLFSDIGPNGLAPIYIELPGGDRFFLPDLKREELESRIRHVEHFSSWQPRSFPNEIVIEDAVSWFRFREGQLSHVRLSWGSDFFLISATQEGPYVKLPITRAQMIEMFGEPTKWARYHEPKAP